VIATIMDYSTPSIYLPETIFLALYLHGVNKSVLIVPYFMWLSQPRPTKMAIGSSFIAPISGAVSSGFLGATALLTKLPVFHIKNPGICP